MIEQQRKMYTVFATGTIGVYGRDRDGQPWTTFHLINGSVRCAVCGAEIKGGWTRGKLGEESYVCSEHVAYERNQS